MQPVSMARSSGKGGAANDTRVPVCRQCHRARQPTVPSCRCARVPLTPNGLAPIEGTTHHPARPGTRARRHSGTPERTRGPNGPVFADRAAHAVRGAGSRLKAEPGRPGDTPQGRNSRYRSLEPEATAAASRRVPQVRLARRGAAARPGRSPATVRGGGEGSEPPRTGLQVLTAEPGAGVSTWSVKRHVQRR